MRLLKGYKSCPIQSRFGCLECSFPNGRRDEKWNNSGHWSQLLYLQCGVLGGHHPGRDVLGQCQCGRIVLSECHHSGCTTNQCFLEYHNAIEGTREFILHRYDESVGYCLWSFHILLASLCWFSSSLSPKSQTAWWWEAIQKSKPKPKPKPE